MARSIWTGALAFGLVNIPVGLYAATEDRTVHFNQFQKGTSDRIRYKRVNERTGDEVNYRDIVKGREVDDDTYVLLTDDELEAVEPGRTRTIDITDFVDLAEVDPIYFQRTYYLAPRGDGADRSYELLHQAMADTNRVGIATFVMRSKEYLVAVRPQQEILALETMYFADEIRDPIEATGYEPSGQPAKPRELDHRPAAHRVDDHRLGPGQLPRQLPRARRGADRKQADRGEDRDGGAGAAGVEGGRPHRDAAPQRGGGAWPPHRRSVPGRGRGRPGSPESPEGSRSPGRGPVRDDQDPAGRARRRAGDPRPVEADPRRAGNGRPPGPPPASQGRLVIAPWRVARAGA